MTDFTTLQEKLLKAKHVMNKVEGDKMQPISNASFTQSNSMSSMPSFSEKKPPSLTQNFIKGKDSGMNMKPKAGITEDKIKGSRLPEDIKKLMIEHPIPDIQMGNELPASFTDGIKEKMDKYVNTGNNSSPQPQRIVESKPNATPTKNVKLNKSTLKNIIKESISEVIDEVIDERIEERLTMRSPMDENLQVKVGDTVFYGKITSSEKF